METDLIKFILNRFKDYILVNKEDFEKKSQETTLLFNFFLSIPKFAAKLNSLPIKLSFIVDGTEIFLLFNIREWFSKEVTDKYPHPYLEEKTPYGYQWVPMKTTDNTNPETNGFSGISTSYVINSTGSLDPSSASSLSSTSFSKYLVED